MADNKKPKREVNKVSDKSGDRGYFILTPRLVWAFSRNPYDYTLWNVVKDIAGEDGQCFLDTSQLAILSMMSDGQVSDSREYLLAVGLVTGKKYREHDYPLPVWHLIIPDLWRPNVEWSRIFSTILARIEFKTQQREAVKKVWDQYKKAKSARKAKGEWEYDKEVFNQVNQAVGFSLYEKPYSPGEKTPTYGEKPSSPGERKNIHDQDHGVNSWMNDDPICNFLRALPGYNPVNLETDRRSIVAHNYSVEGLSYLWADAKTEGDNPIGLFLYRSAQGLHSPAYLDVLAERKRQASIGEHHVQTLEHVAAEDAKQPNQSDRIEDDSVTRPLNGEMGMTPVEVWSAVQGELQLEMARATYETWVGRTAIVSVNGNWKIAVPDKQAMEWLNLRLHSTVKRILNGVVGHPVDFEFVVFKEWLK